MSHFTKVRTSLRDEDALVQALRDQGWTPEVHADPVKLRGFLTSRRGHVVVRREALSVRWSDLGFERTPDGMFSAWVDSELLKVDPHLLERITARSAYHTTRWELAQQGFSVVEETQKADGSLRLTLRRHS